MVHCPPLLWVSEILVVLQHVVVALVQPVQAHCPEIGQMVLLAAFHSAERVAYHGGPWEDPGAFGLATYLPLAA